MIISKPNRKNH